ncbi:DUF5343 domain-containing protein [Curtobacterium sp. Csp1]|uniref:DUF5343 domain-containing protein n=1 Tax=unclassified Curtobacterium TaxID=257496 RepID=UPI001598D683|nr:MULTISPECIES: DUF5343 domain-containing protein [unclassified Curtobacterium]QKS13800.1 DUF5343 domain-containing protein [Curtobacterium sp. csp3]QKS20844.1 DUF5343 domain-containing protein [Curtobacterium sp. Csp1]
MIEPGGIAPYAPSSAVMRVITAKRRDRSLSHFGPDDLLALGIRESLAPRTLQALKLLELLNEEGETTEVFEGLATPSRADFSSRLGSLLRHVYAPIFEFIGSDRTTHEEVADAFQQFGPPSQRPRMVTLFMNLLREARMTPSSEPRALTAEAVVQLDAASESQALISPAEVRQAGDSESARRRPRQTFGSFVAAPPSGSPSRHRLKLASGGSVDIGLDVDLFSLSKEDRDFVMDLVDRVTNYKPKRTESDSMR